MDRASGPYAEPRSAERRSGRKQWPDRCDGGAWYSPAHCQIFQPRQPRLRRIAGTPVHRSDILSRSVRAGNADRSSFRNIVNDLFTMGIKAPEGSEGVGATILPESAGGPSAAQRRYLERGLREAGGKLPLFDEAGREIPRRTIEACVAHGWAELWGANPVKPDWLVCRLTEAGYRVLGHERQQEK